MAQINIDGGAGSDAFFRYKRDVVILKHEAKHGGQTRLENLERICKQLGVERAPLCKFVQKHLGCTRVSSDNVIRQQLRVEQVEAALEAFTKQHVLCSTCHLPELDATTKICRACGNKYGAKPKKKAKEKEKKPAKRANKDNDDTSGSDEDEEKNTVPGLDETMKQLYGLRDASKKEQQASIDRLLDACWACETIEALALIQADMKKTLA